MIVGKSLLNMVMPTGRFSRSDTISILGFFFILSLVSNCAGQFCNTSDENASYHNISEPCNLTNIMIGCEVTKQCKYGYATSLESNNNQTLICTNTSTWEDEEPCIGCCEFGNRYGANCSQTFGACSSICECSPASGCVKVDEEEYPWAACDLGDLSLSAEQNTVYGTIGVTEELVIKAKVNIVDEDVSVAAIFNGKRKELNHTADGIYQLLIEVNLSSNGVYQIRAETNVSEEENNVTVIVYDPAKIEGVYQNPGNSKLLKGRTTRVIPGMDATWTCEAVSYEPLEVSWYFGGISISEVQLEDRLYQIRNSTNDTTMSTLYIHSGKNLQAEDSGTYVCVVSNENKESGDIFADVQEINLVVGQPAEEYTPRTDFVIAVSIIGFFTFVTIICTTALAILFHKNKSESGRKTVESRPKRANNYSPDPRPMLGRQEPAFSNTSDPRVSSGSLGIQPESASMRMNRRTKASLPKPRDQPTEASRRFVNEGPGTYRNRQNPPIRLQGMHHAATVHRNDAFDTRDPGRLHGHSTRDDMYEEEILGPSHNNVYDDPAEAENIYEGAI